MTSWRRRVRCYRHFIAYHPFIATGGVILVTLALGLIGILGARELGWVEASIVPSPEEVLIHEKEMDAVRERLIARIEPTIPKRYGSSVEKTTNLTEDEKTLKSTQVSVCKVNTETTKCDLLEYGDESYQARNSPELSYWLNVVHSRRRTHYWLHLRQSLVNADGEVSWAGNYAIDPGEAFIFTLGMDEVIRVVRGADQ